MVIDPQVLSGQSFFPEQKPYWRSDETIFFPEGIFKVSFIVFRDQVWKVCEQNERGWHSLDLVYVENINPFPLLV